MSVTTPVIREARVDDEAELWPMASALATSYEPTQERFRIGLRGIIEDPHATVLVADQNGRLVGYVHVLVHDAFHADGMIGWVEELMVGEDQRGTGCGRELMNAAERWATENFDIAYLAVATRRAEGFYRSIGYDESATYFKKSFR
ncbi:GNAT family N-acetyltransferase [Brachybacterium sp. 107]|uniref:GNAT family N-acetyltransferase n=1 Tax=Brachybacterium sp. 107 TaxID=3457736 RepID=UPI004033E3F9